MSKKKRRGCIYQCTNGIKMVPVIIDGIRTTKPEKCNMCNGKGWCEK